ncbi:MAG: hypothetical protein V3U26_06525, partial [Dehalococcoidia bacterium]
LFYSSPATNQLCSLGMIAGSFECQGAVEILRCAQNDTKVTPVILSLSKDERARLRQAGYCRSYFESLSMSGKRSQHHLLVALNLFAG